eukprot:365853-Chlamydomonas_euryale.AAC.1
MPTLPTHASADAPARIAAYVPRRFAKVGFTHVFMGAHRALPHTTFHTYSRMQVCRFSTVGFVRVFMGAHGALQHTALHTRSHACRFAMIGFMRVFMGAARDRLETLNVSPSASTYAHMRALALVLLILGHDLVGAAALASSLSHMSTTKALLCAFDMAVVAVEGIK